MAISLRSVLVLSGFAALLLGCSGASWMQAQTAPWYRAPKQLRVAVVVQRDLIVNRVEDLTPAIGELKQVLAEELVSRGISTTFINQPDNTPVTELNVIEWEPGSRGLRAFRFTSGEAHMTIVVRSPSADGQPGFAGTARGHLSSGFYGGSSMTAVREVAQLIARSIATGIAK